MGESNVDDTESDYTRRQLLCTLGLGAGSATENQVSSTVDSDRGIITQNYRNNKTTQVVRFTLGRKEFEERYRQIQNDDPGTAQKIMGRDAFERYYDGQATEFVKMNILYRPDVKSPANSKLQLGLVQAGEIEDINNVPSRKISYSGWQNVSDTVARKFVPDSALGHHTNRSQNQSAVDNSTVQTEVPTQVQTDNSTTIPTEIQESPLNLGSMLGPITTHYSFLVLVTVAGLSIGGAAWHYWVRDQE